ncbi:MAG: nitroreductase [Pseudomonadota bacterium]
MPDNPVIDFMRRRRSVLAAKMTAPGPGTADLETMLEIGLRVPDHGKIEPWRVQILRAEGQRRLGELYAAIVARDPDCRGAQIDAARERLQRSPLLLVVSSHPDQKRVEKIPLIEQRLSAGAVCTNLLIAATALGYAAQWLTGGPAYEPEIREALGHGADTVIAGFIHIGSVAEPPPERPRPDRDRIVSEWPNADA